MSNENPNEQRTFTRSAFFMTRLQSIPNAHVPTWETVASYGRGLLWPHRHVFTAEDVDKAFFFQQCVEAEFVQTGYSQQATMAYMRDLLA